MPRGRPTKYSPQVGHRLAALVRYGATLEDAARSEGVPSSTAYDWAHKQRDFAEQLERARGDFITENLRHMNVAAMRGSWQASAWLLEHIVPDRFGKAATELPVVLSLLLQKLPPEIAGQVAAIWGIVGALSTESGVGGQGDPAPAGREAGAGLPTPTGNANSDDAGT